jgi:hypothetical protein
MAGFGARGRVGTTTPSTTERPGPKGLHRKDAMYIGIGTVVLILIILLLIGVLR